MSGNFNPDWLYATDLLDDIIDPTQTNAKAGWKFKPKVKRPRKPTTASATSLVPKEEIRIISSLAQIEESLKNSRVTTSEAHNFGLRAPESEFDDRFVDYGVVGHGTGNYKVIVFRAPVFFGRGAKNRIPRTESKIELLNRDLLVEILLWLPGKSLHRCKSVQKSWNHIINESLKDRLFVAEHFKRSHLRPSLLVSVRSKYGVPRLNNMRRILKKELVSICNYNTELVFTLQFVHGFRSAFLERFCESDFWPDMGSKSFIYLSRQDKELSSWQFSAPCNGIIFFRHLHDHTLGLINTGLGQYRFLECDRLCERRLGCYVGLGFDAFRKIYKAVRLTFVNVSSFVADIWMLGKGDGENQIDGRRRIMVRTDHKFAKVGVENDQHVFCNHVYYWLFNCNGDSDNPILSFDMHSETFRTIRLPRFGAPNGSYPLSCSLLVWRNKRVILLRYEVGPKGSREEAPQPIESWVLEEDGCSWSKFVTVPIFDPTAYRPLTFWNDGNELLLQSNSLQDIDDDGWGGNHLASYNIITTKFRTLRHTPGMKLHVYASAYVQSLIWI